MLFMIAIQFQNMNIVFSLKFWFIIKKQGISNTVQSQTVCIVRSFLKLVGLLSTVVCLLVTWSFRNYWLTSWWTNKWCVGLVVGRYHANPGRKDFQIRLQWNCLYVWKRDIEDHDHSSKKHIFSIFCNLHVRQWTLRSCQSLNNCYPLSARVS